MKKTNKNEKRRLAFEKRNVKKEMNLARYGAEGGSALVMAKTGEFNRRLLAALLAMVFVLTTLVLGLNIAVQAEDEVIVDGTYVGEYQSERIYSVTNALGSDVNQAPKYTAVVVVKNGAFDSVDITCTNTFSGPSIWTNRYYWNQNINSGISHFLAGSSDAAANVNARQQLINNAAEKSAIDNLVILAIDATSENGTLADPNNYDQFVEMREALVNAVKDARTVVPNQEQPEEPAAPESLITPESQDAGGIVTSKTIQANDQGNYDLTIESYATAPNVTEQIPTDIVLILDQSGSMYKDDMPVTYTNGENGNWRIEDIPTDTDDSSGVEAYYVKDGKNYYRVYKKRGYMYEYIAPNTVYVGDILKDTPLSWFQGQDSIEQNLVGQYYYKENNIYYPVTINVSGRLLRYDTILTYNNGIYLKHDDTPYYQNPSGGYFGPGDYYIVPYGVANAAVKALFGVLWAYNEENFHHTYTFAELTSNFNSGMYIQNTLYKRHIGYNQLCYKDASGEEHVLINATYCDADGNALGGQCINGNPSKTDPSQLTNEDNAFWNGPLFRAENKTTRLEALNSALKQFANTVKVQTNSDGTKPDHRIAIVGFSSFSNSNPVNDYYKNTELLTGKNFDVQTESFYRPATDGSHYYSLDDPVTNHNGKQYSEVQSDNDYYANALLSVNDATDWNKINTAIDAVTAYGGTEPKYGFDMAYNVLKQRNPEDLKYRKKDNSEGDRNQVIIFFTDGRPGNYSFDNQYYYANEVIDAAYTIKSDSDLGSVTPIYSVGTFGEADANPLLYQEDTIFRSSYNPTYHETGIINNDREFYAANNSYLNARLARQYRLDFDHAAIDTGVTQDSNGDYQVSSSAQFAGQYRIWQNDPTNSAFPPTATDTIADYMETVSSAYPNATKFVDQSWWGTGTKSNGGNYNNMVSASRGSRNPDDKQYYYLASNKNALARAFTEIFASVSSADTSFLLDGTHAVLRDVVSTGFDKTDDTSIEISSVKGTVLEDGVSIEWMEPTSDTYGAKYDEEKWANSKTLDVDGFDYSTYYFSTKNTEHDNVKLVVRITNIVPNTVGSQIYSNDNENSGVYYKTNENELIEFAKLPKPSINRHSYRMIVGNENQNGRFATTTSIVDSNTGTAVVLPFDDPSLDNTVLVAPDGTRIKYSEITNDKLSSFGDMGNGEDSSTFYYENVPAGFQIQTGVDAKDSSYTYTWRNLPSPQELNLADTPKQLLDYEDSIIYIDSVANSKDVTFHLAVDEPSPFVDSDYKFSVDVTLTGDNISDKFDSLTEENPGVEFVVVDNDTIQGTIKMTYGTGDPITPVTIKVPDGATLSVDHSDPFYTLKSISESENGAPAYEPHPITATTDIYIEDTINTDVGAGVAEDNNGSRAIIYALASLAIISGGAGATYVYRKKDEFAE